MGGKFTIFAWFYFVFEGKFQVLATRGAYIRRDDVTGFFALRFLGGLYSGGGGGGLFSEFYSISNKAQCFI